MNTTATFPAVPTSAGSGSSLYHAVWRWPVYAGLIVAPIPPLSGLVVLYGNSVEAYLSKVSHIRPGGSATLEQQAAAAVAAVPGGRLQLVVLPAEPHRVGVALVEAAGSTAAAVCLAFPLTGLAILLFAAVDVLLPKRLKEAVA